MDAESIAKVPDFALTPDSIAEEQSYNDSCKTISFGVILVTYWLVLGAVLGLAVFVAARHLTRGKRDGT